MPQIRLLCYPVGAAALWLGENMHSRLASGLVMAFCQALALPLAIMRGRGGGVGGVGGRGRGAWEVVGVCILS